MMDPRGCLGGPPKRPRAPPPHPRAQPAPCSPAAHRPPAHTPRSHRSCVTVKPRSDIFSIHPPIFEHNVSAVSVKEDLSDLEEQVLPLLEDVPRAQVSERGLVCGRQGRWRRDAAGCGGCCSCRRRPSPRPAPRTPANQPNALLRCAPDPLPPRPQEMATRVQGLWRKYARPEVLAADWDRLLVRVSDVMPTSAAPPAAACVLLPAPAVSGAPVLRRAVAPCFLAHCPLTPKLKKATRVLNNPPPSLSCLPQKLGEAVKADAQLYYQGQRPSEAADSDSDEAEVPAAAQERMRAGQMGAAEAERQAEEAEEEEPDAAGDADAEQQKRQGGADEEEEGGQRDAKADADQRRS